jgi:pimeloyl-ACP methyl ester carboxylesterase
MKRVTSVNRISACAAACLLFTPFAISQALISASLPGAARIAGSPIASRTATVDGLSLLYLPGIGESEIPADGLDMKTATIRLHALAKSLGVEKARVVGHDIGLMVAYAYAAQFPTETEKIVVMDAFLPGVAG